MCLPEGLVDRLQESPRFSTPHFILSSHTALINVRSGGQTTSSAARPCVSVSEGFFLHPFPLACNWLCPEAKSLLITACSCFLSGNKCSPTNWSARRVKCTYIIQADMIILNKCRWVSSNRWELHVSVVWTLWSIWQSVEYVRGSELQTLSISKPLSNRGSLE